jgi:HSP20 family protein
MKVDIKETDKEYIVEAEIPGVDKKDIQLELHDDLLTIQVQRNEQLDVENNNYIRKERRTSSMSRSFYVENVKQEDVTAKYENGILSIVLPKREPGIKKGKNIEIQ